MPDDPLARCQYPTTPASVGLARDLCRQCLSTWAAASAPADADAVTLIVSELATNAVLHGQGGEFGLTIALYGDTCHVGVWSHGGDPSGEPLTVEPLPPDDAPCGRGLFLVQAFADRWGCHVDSEAVTVWAEKRLAPCTA